MLASCERSRGYVDFCKNGAATITARGALAQLSRQNRCVVVDDGNAHVSEIRNLLELAADAARKEFSFRAFSRAVARD